MSSTSSPAKPVVEKFQDQIPQGDQLTDTLKSLNIRPGEYQKILNHLGRAPNFTELCMFSAMWSEHCCYKHTRHLLKKLPTEGPHILQGPGENAGIVDVGDGVAVAFKIESHNHPTYVEPYQGATTGVGGILRDIITMNARPVAVMNALRFGPLESGKTASRSAAGNAYRFWGAIHGIGDYGNCTGIPTLGGDIFFNETYASNPLVNAFALGFMQPGGMMAAGAKGVGNPVLYVGSSTGRDGMGGAAFASRSLNETKRAEDRPAVQVGDPFSGKLLLEAVLEAYQTGCVVAAQDMGAAGLTCATCEMAGKGDLGMRIDLDKVPARAPGMVPWEFLSSESQERFVLVLEKGKEQPVLDVFAKWDIPAVVIGEVIAEERVHVDFHGERVVDLPAKLLTDLAPSYAPGDRPLESDAHKARRQKDPFEGLPSLAFQDLPQWIPQFIGKTGNLPLPTAVFQQYDRHVRNNTLLTSENNTAGVIRLRNKNDEPLPGLLAMTLDGNPRYVDLEPYSGSMAAVSEAARNLVCVGAKPLAITNNLNYGDPEVPEVYYQLYYSVEGIKDACLMYNTPVTGGNVSLYNTHDASAIIPSPVIGMIGRVASDELLMTSAWKTPGSKIALVGRFRPSIGGSEYQVVQSGKHFGPPPSLSIKDEKALMDWLLNSIIPSGNLLSLDDLSLGGLLIALIEGALTSSSIKGAEIDLTPVAQVFPDSRWEEWAFGETHGTYLITYAPEDEAELIEKFNGKKGEQWLWISLGTVTDSPSLSLRLKEETVRIPLDTLHPQWHHGLEPVS